MSKKKRKKSTSQQRDAIQPSQASPKHPKIWLITGGVIFLGIAIALFFWFRLSRSTTIVQSRPPNELAEPPNVNLTSAEKEVAQKIERLRKDVIAKPKSSEAWGRLGMNLDVHDFRQQAVECYQQAARLTSDNFKWSYYCAIALNDLGSPDAIDWFERTIKIKKDYAPLYVRYANVLYDLGRTQESAQAYQRALDIKPQTLHAMIGLARVALSKGDLENCLKNLESARAINPNIREIHGLLSEVYRRKNELDKAQRETLVANQLPKKTVLNDQIYSEIGLEGVSSTSYESRGRAYLQRGMYPEAAQEFEAVLRIRPEARIYDSLGLALLYQGKTEDAIKQHRRAVEMNPENATAWDNLAQALFKAGNTKEAIESAEQGVKRDPELSYSYVTLGSFYQSLGETDQAIEIYRKGLEKNPGHRRLQENLARLLIESGVGKSAEAIKIATDLCESTEYQDPELLDLLATAYAKSGNFREAIHYASKAQQLAASLGKTVMANQIAEKLKAYQSRLD
ncbi:tetratricopeptide repeat protein [bacterium]|nr:tetratricopeptide repeat protein [bacterium]MCI0614625.1 tetratricopeptide repeat protein [bacterium]